MTPTLTRIPESPGAGRLGRHILHDPRSLAYRTTPAAPASLTWTRYTPILDQAATSSCTGNALIGALGTGPLYSALKGAGLLSGNPLDEAEARSIYSDAEILDGGAGLPTEDEGSTGLSVAKVAQRRGLISGYRHAMSVDEAHGALQAGPFIIGTDWLTGMDSPRPDGTVSVSGGSRGGHEYLCREYDATRDLWWFDNSWGRSFGVAGRFAYDTPGLEALLGRQGDITALVPLSQPAPTPGPITRSFTPEQAAALEEWADKPHLWHLASVAARAWRDAKVGPA
jgi:hypothetical protein